MVRRKFKLKPLEFEFITVVHVERYHFAPAKNFKLPEDSPTSKEMLYI